jgi:hypothetical protein
MSSHLSDKRADPAEQHQNPALVVGSWQGDVAVVDCATEALCWRRQTGHEAGALAQDGERFYLSPGSSRSKGRTGICSGMRCPRSSCPFSIQGSRPSDGLLMRSVRGAEGGHHAVICSPIETSAISYER